MTRPTDATEAGTHTRRRSRPRAGRFDSVPLDSVIYGAGAADDLEGECERLGIRRALVFASASLARRFDVRRRLDRATGGRVAHVFTGGRAHLPRDVVLVAADAARAARADGLISIGGSSVSDLAKAVSLCLAEDVRSVEALVRWRATFEPPDCVQIPASAAPQLPHIAIPTTLSAGEFTPGLAITDPERRVKDIYVMPSLVPRVVVLDPRLAAHTPRQLWASTGVRAIDHAVETLASTSAQPFTDALCADALDRLVRHLPPSARDGEDLHAAGECQIGAWLSFCGLRNVGLGLSHGIGHQLGARCGVPHGVASCVTLPAVLDFNRDHSAGAQDRVAETLRGATPSPAGLGAGELMRRFIASLGLPTALRAVGVEKSDLRPLATATVADFVIVTNPRPATSADDVLGVLERAY